MKLNGCDLRVFFKKIEKVFHQDVFEEVLRAFESKAILLNSVAFSFILSCHEKLKRKMVHKSASIEEEGKMAIKPICIF